MFHDWDSFYLLIGGASGGLIGLLFVVASLTSSLEERSATAGASLYMTPVVFHFGVILTLSAMAAAPRLPATAAGLIVAAAALAGLAYCAVIILGISGGKAPNPPHWSDIWCYGFVPTVAYLVLGAAAVTVWTAPASAPWVMASGLIALLLIGIRNAWDLITWLAPRARGAA